MHDKVALRIGRRLHRVHHDGQEEEGAYKEVQQLQSAKRSVQGNHRYDASAGKPVRRASEQAAPFLDGFASFFFFFCLFSDAFSLGQAKSPSGWWWHSSMTTRRTLGEEEPCIRWCDVSLTCRVNDREVTSMIHAQNAGVEVVSAKDGIDGLVLLKTNAEDLRLCLADMVMPGLSGIELLNRARADPALEHITFALMTEFSSGSISKKSLSSFQVSDDRGDPVSVLIKPLHQALVADMIDKLGRPEPPQLIRKHSDASLLNAGLEADPDWQRARSRSDWTKVRPQSTELPQRTATPPSSEASPRGSPGRELVSPRNSGGGGSGRTVGISSTGIEGSPAPRRPGSGLGSPRRGSGTFSGARDSKLAAVVITDSPKTRKKSLTVSGDTREEAHAMAGSPPKSEGVPRSASQYQIGTDAQGSPAMPRSTSMYSIEGGLTPPSPMVSRTRGSPKSSPRLGRGSQRGKMRDGSPMVSPRADVSPPEVSTADTGSKRWSMRHNQVGVVDESQGVNDIMFDSISSLDRDSVTRSVSMDMLNWDEVV